MKASFESLASSSSSSFLVRSFAEPAFSAPFHFHPEYELTLITEGTGKRYVGAHMCDYFPGDLVLLGSNLPHCWKTTPGQQEYSLSRSIVIQFHHHFIGNDFFEKPEMQKSARLLLNSRYGIRFEGPTEEILFKMHRIGKETDATKRLIQLLDMLHDLAAWPGIQLLDRQEVYPRLSIAEKERLNAVMAYILENFQSDISLQTAASIANMTHFAFCRYFKRTYRKTFMEVVIDYRIDFAMQQLIYTDKTIAGIAFESGFNDISNFHKAFKARLNTSPLSYRKQFASLASGS